MSSDGAKRPMGLQLKLVLLLLAIGSVPVIVSAVLIDRISEVAQNFASNEISRMGPSLEKSQAAYRALVSRTKELHIQVAERVDRDPDSVHDPSLRELGLLRVVHRGPDGETIFETSTGRSLTDGEREVLVERPSPGGGKAFAFAVDESVMVDYQELAEVLEERRRVQTVRRSLPSSYRTAFIVVVGGFAVLLTTLGVFLGRRVTRRIDELVLGFRAVAGGDLSVRLSGKGRDEIGEMGRAFNRMVADLEAERRKSAYLQRIGTWQDVARKLAHEIKNPLTPIQLAVQQVQSSYDGSDQKFGKLLDDAEEIVREEIDNLRRLVDAFRELGRLPRVEAKPVGLQVILDDLLKDPTVAEHMRLQGPSEEITVLADRLLLRRVLHNLVSNAVEAGGSPVTIHWRGISGGRAEIVVDDCGTGVEAELRETLFEPYITSKETGTGLGLAISKKIAIEHGGALEFADEPSESGGARFVLVVPMVADEA